MARGSARAQHRNATYAPKDVCHGRTRGPETDVRAHDGRCDRGRAGYKLDVRRAAVTAHSDLTGAYGISHAPAAVKSAPVPIMHDHDASCMHIHVHEQKSESS